MSKQYKIIRVFIFSAILAGFLFIFLSKKDKKSEIFKETPLSTSFLENPNEFWLEPEIVLVEKTYLKPLLPPALIFSKTFAVKNEEVPADEENLSSEEKGIIEYFVKEGETLSSLAQKFNLSLNTILWANNLNKNAVLKPGQKLIILPVDGLIHQVKKGDTLSEIAILYKAKIEDIISYNDLESADDIFIGEILIIPGGTMPSKKPSTSSLKTETPSLPIAQNYFICPVSGGCRISQGLHWYNAVDFSNGKCGEPILAAAGGRVQKTKFGWNGGAGNYVSILHPNGVVTVYYHLQTIFVSPNQEVSQGEIIGLMGKSGKSTGCHLHFGIFGAENPFGK